jgi:hypothetical protein
VLCFCLALMSGSTFMKLTVITAVTILIFSCITTHIYSQGTRSDSVQRGDEVRMQKMKDEDRMTKVKDANDVTKANAKEAHRIGRDADNAERESRSALRAEKKAQRARKHADRQAQKALKARQKSNDN